ncbi:MAG: NAD-dependent epimerase/dehydratase family protein [Promethearchaeota archaeon]
MKALVTGGTGFLGSHIVDELVEADYDVRVLARKSSNITQLPSKIEVVVGDITLAETLTSAMRDIEVVFNNAAIMEDWGDWSKFAPVNVEGTRNVLEAARKLDISTIAHTSSCALYGFPNSDTPITEDFPKNPFGDYQKSKWAAEQIVDDYVEIYGMDIVSVRPPFILGSRDHYTTPTIVDAIQKGQMVVIGNGKQVQSVVHARDAAYCLRLAAEHPNSRGEAFNVTSFNLPAEELYTRYAELLAEKSTFRHIPYRVAWGFAVISEGFARLRRKKESPLMTIFRVKLLGTHYLIDSTKAEEKLGYQPRFDADATIQDSLKSYFAQDPDKELPLPLREK